MKKKVAVFDYGSGNIHSAVKAIVAAGAEVSLTKDRTECLQADGLVIPGVGAFAAVMEQLTATSADAIVDQRLSAGRGVLGICVGMQVMFDKGVEHGVETAGFGQWPGVVSQLDSPKLPNIGWSKVQSPSDSKLFAGVSDEYFYFVHSYAAKNWELDIQLPFQAATVSTSNHGESFLAAIENGPLWATQFHPEKSGAAGIRLLQNWIASL